MGRVDRAASDGGFRLLSYSEIETALTCWARWDFAYGGRLAGSTLKPLRVSAKLGDGKIWGEAVATWHANSDRLDAAWLAHEALLKASQKEQQALLDRGFQLNLVEVIEAEQRLSAMLDHYMATTEPLPNLTRIEEEVIVPIPSRGGKRASTHYRFLCYMDGFVDEQGRRRLVEFKLRDSLQSVELVQLSPQIRWYLWGLYKRDGVLPFGVYVDERLNEIPKPAQINHGRGRPIASHKKDQLTTPELYIKACHDTGEEPKLEVVQHLRARQWQQRIPLTFRPSEIAEAGRELVSAAKLIRDLDSGELEPIRNGGKPQICRGCKFREICAAPQDRLYVESLFERTVPKRLRDPIPIERRAA